MSNETMKTAAERLESLEGTVGQIIQALQPLDLVVKDVLTLKEQNKFLVNKLDAVTKAINQGLSLTDENLSKIMTDNNVQELKNKLATMVSSGLLAPTDTVGENTFLVLSETNKDGILVNPRMQFLLANIQDKNIVSKLVGAKVGDNVAIGDTGDSVTVLEAYNIVPPPVAAPVEQAAPADAAPAATDTAPASTDSAAPAATDSSESTAAQETTDTSAATTAAPAPAEQAVS